MSSNAILRMTATFLAALALDACHPAPPASPPPTMFSQDHGQLVVPAGSPLRTRVAVAPVGSDASGAVVDLPAAIEADPARVANVLAPLTGRLVTLDVRLGQHVRRGQVLATMASGDFDQAVADERKALDAADLAKRALDRTEGVQSAGGLAVKDTETARSAYEQAKAELARSRDRLRALNPRGGSGRGRLALTAPQDGVVTTLAVGAGAQVGDPTATLMTVTNIDRVFVTANVAESDIGKATIGTAAAIVLDGDPGHLLTGRIAEVDPVVQPDTRRQKVRIVVDNGAGRLLPNMYATVRLRAPSAPAVVVPQSALLMDNDTTTVLVERRPWVFERRVVQIADETDTTARVLSGLGAGDRVVVRGGVLFGD